VLSEFCDATSDAPAPENTDTGCNRGGMGGDGAARFAHMSGKLFGSLVGNPKREFRLPPAMRDTTLR